MNLNENIRLLRKKVKLTQEKLAELISCSIDTLQRWENGTREPRASDIRKLCDVLGCTESELLNGPSDEKVKITLVYDWGRMKEGNVDDATYARIGQAFLVCAEYPEVFEGVTMEKFCSMFVDVIPDGESELTARAKAHAVEMYKLLNKVFSRLEFTGLDDELKKLYDAPADTPALKR